MYESENGDVKVVCKCKTIVSMRCVEVVRVWCARVSQHMKLLLHTTPCTHNDQLGISCYSVEPLPPSQTAGQGETCIMHINSSLIQTSAPRAHTLHKLSNTACITFSTTAWQLFSKIVALAYPSSILHLTFFT